MSLSDRGLLQIIPKTEEHLEVEVHVKDKEIDLPIARHACLLFLSPL